MNPPGSRAQDSLGAHLQRTGSPLGECRTAMECAGLVVHPSVCSDRQTLSRVLAPCYGDIRSLSSGQPEAGHGVCFFPAEPHHSDTTPFLSGGSHSSKTLFKSILLVSRGQESSFFDSQYLLPSHRCPVICCSLLVTLWLVSVLHYGLILLYVYLSCTAPNTHM